MKKVLLVAFVLIFALTGLAFAAKSSSRPASRPSAPAVKSAPTTQTAPSSGYKPSAPASSYNDKAALKELAEKVVFGDSLAVAETHFYIVRS